MTTEGPGRFPDNTIFGELNTRWPELTEDEREAAKLIREMNYDNRS